MPPPVRDFSANVTRVTGFNDSAVMRADGVVMRVR
jgi:hypothetical protein